MRSRTNPRVETGTKLSRRSFAAALAAAPWIVARAQPAPLHARIKVDTERVIGDIDPKIYGNFGSAQEFVGSAGIAELGLNSQFADG